MSKAFYESLAATIAASERDAYVYFGETHSYAKMWAWMRSANAHLSRHRGQRIALYAGKGFPTYCALFAILASGNTWVPFNPELPELRNLEMLKVASPRMVIADRELPEPLSRFAEQSGAEVVRLEALVAGERTEDFALDALDPDQVAIIFFTSGSTGVPKGVPLTHANYVNTVHNILDALPLRKGEVFADYHDLGFVLSVAYLFPCVLSESAFAPAITEGERLIPIKNLVDNRVTVLITVPSTIARVRSLNREGIANASLRILCLAGEPFHLDLLEYCLNKLGLDNVNDFYGSTEVGCWTFHHRCAADDLITYRDVGFVPIGRPLKGNHVLLTDEDELLVSGPQITTGYLDGGNREKFREIEGKRWFAMGDKVIERNGVYFCKGRLDSQVKIGGYRIELMDTEAHLRTLEGVDQVVCFIASAGGHDFIVAALHGEQEYGAAEVRESLKDKLPGYMMPRSVYHLDELPLNKSGKIDRLAVRSRYVAAQVSET